MSIHPQYITDTAGKKLVVLPINEFNSILDELEEVEDMIRRKKTMNPLFP